MESGVRGPGLEIRLRYSRQLLDEGNDRPDLFVLGADLTEARHSRHFDAVLDHPEELRGLSLLDDVFQIGRIRLQPFREFLPVHARGAVTIAAAPRGKGLSAGAHDVGILEIDGTGIARVTRNRSHADLDQRPIDDGRVLLACCNIEEAAEEKDRHPQGDDDCENTDASQNSHGRPSLSKHRGVWLWLHEFTRSPKRSPHGIRAARAAEIPEELT